MNDYLVSGDVAAHLENLSETEKKTELFNHQKHTLDLFLERGAITKEQYDVSLGTLKKKLEIE